MSKGSNVQQFNYTDSKGKKSFRTAYVLHGASDLALTVDLSEFNEEEQKYYEGVIDSLREKFYEQLKEHGLGGNIRTFKEKNMVLYEDMLKKTKLAGETP